MGRPTDRILGLDMVRSIAIFFVLLPHSTFVFQKNTQELIQTFVPAIGGVSVFFVLSGFLIGGIFLRESEQERFTIRNLGQFWIRRWFRTLPNYFLVLVLLLIYDNLIYRTESPYNSSYLFFAQNLFSHAPDFFPESWSLAVEEWFYFIFPLVSFLGFIAFSQKKIVILVVAAVFLIVPFMLKIAACNDGSCNVVHTVIFRLDSLMYGIFGAYAHRYHKELWSGFRLPGLIASVAIVMYLTIRINILQNADATSYPYLLTLESLATLFALPYFSELRTIRSIRFSRVVTFVSITSYSMYVLNLSIVQWRLLPAILSRSGLRTFTGEYSTLVSFVLFWPTVVLLSYILYKYFELPMMNIRDKIRLNNRAAHSAAN